MKTATLAPTRLDCSRTTGTRAAAVNIAAILLATDTRDWFSTPDPLTNGLSRYPISGIPVAKDYVAFLGRCGLHRAPTDTNWLEPCAPWQETTTEMIPDAITKILTAWKTPQTNSTCAFDSLVKRMRTALDTSAAIAIKHASPQVAASDDHERVDW